jgi:hypothetical protein
MNFAEELKQAAQRTTGNNVFNSADAAKAELDKLGTLIAERMDCILSKAPVKSRKRAAEKVHIPKAGQEHLAGDWLAVLKDYARITLCPRTETTAAVEKVGKLLRTLMSDERIYGYGQVKAEETVAEQDPCGYSGFNFVVRFGALTSNPANAGQMVDKVALAMGIPGATRPASSSGSAFSGPTRARSSSEPPPLPGFQDNLQSHHLAGDQHIGKKVALDSLPKIRFDHIGRFGEIQVNTMPLLYAKASKEDFHHLFGAEKYMACLSRFGVVGGLGHVLYEHYRSTPGTERALQAAALSKRYYGRMRGTDRRPVNSLDDTLKRDMDAYITRWGSH